MRFKNFFQLYTEGASPTLFHHTDVRNLAKILNSGKFQLTFSLSERPDRKNLKDDAFYMSFSRIRWSGYNHGSGIGSAIIQVNGSKINQKYKVEPVDYWQYGFETRLKSPIADEQEDRLMYKKSSIPAIPYIENVSILVSDDFNSKEYASYIVNKCEELNIPCYVYDDKRAFKLGDKRRAKDFEKLKDLPEDQYNYPPSEYMMSRLRGIKKIILNPYLDDEDVEHVYKTLGYSDWKQSIDADFHNIKSDLNPQIREILEWVAFTERKTKKSIFTLLKDAADKRNSRDNILSDIRSLSGLMRFIREGSAPGWASLKRESIPYYIRESRFPDVNYILQKSIQLAQDTDVNDDGGWMQIAELLQNAIELLKDKLPMQ